MGIFSELLAEHIGLAFARQLAFADCLGQRDWNVNITEGVVRFGEDLKFPIQLLGSEAYDSDTWLWAWANKASNLPDELLVSVARVRSVGEQRGIRELSEPRFGLDVASGHALALAASGIVGECCYYRGPYDGGALFFLVGQPPDAVLQPARSERVVTVITEIISQFDVEHRKMAETFLRTQGFDIDRQPAHTLASRDCDTITLDFDARGRLSGIRGTLKPTQEAPAKKWWQFWKS